MVALWHWVAHKISAKFPQHPIPQLAPCESERSPHSISSSPGVIAIELTQMFFSVGDLMFLHLWLKICQRNSPHTDLGEKSQQKWQFRILQGPFFLIFPLEPPLSAGMFHVGHYRMSLIPGSRKSSHLPSSHLVNLDTQLVNQDVLD